MSKKDPTSTRSCDLLHLVLAQQLVPLPKQLPEKKGETIERPLSFELMEEAVLVAFEEGQWVADALQDLEIDLQTSKRSVSVIEACPKLNE